MCCVAMTRVHLHGLGRSTSTKISSNAALAVWSILFVAALNVLESVTRYVHCFYSYGYFLVWFIIYVGDFFLLCYAWLVIFFEKQYCLS